MPHTPDARGMPSRRRPLVLLAAVNALAILAASLLMLGVAHAAQAEPLDFEPDVLAKLAKEKARAGSLNAQAAARGKPRGESSADCGAVNIGNVVGAKSGFAPTEVNVIITGDVINVNNKCR